MKAFNKLCVLALACLAFVACDKHDKLDDLVFVGKMAPTVYWSVASTTVSAGDSVGFDAQYYTTGEAPVSHCEVWYNVMEVEAKEVTSAALPSISYTVTNVRRYRIYNRSCHSVCGVRFIGQEKCPAEDILVDNSLYVFLDIRCGVGTSLDADKRSYISTRRKRYE